MLSVGRIDGRKGLGFGVGGEMEEAELEEGEASCYQDEDAGMDRDVALSSLSYIDERIQHVLGHFQKDFEGGVSAENLGAKFGGYGSFLPTHQRSPSIWSHPRSPHKVQTYSTPKSPNNLLVEGGQNRPSLTSGSHSVRHASDPNNVRLSSNNSSTTCILEDVNTNRSVSAADQKMLKLRIKVGSNFSHSAKKNAAIYSGLGLMSPSSSLEDSPSMSGGLSPEFHAPDEYPLTLLQRMKSFVVPGEQLVSPLHDCLLRISEKKHHLKDSKTEADQKGSQPIPTKLTGEHIIRDKKGFGEKKTKSVEKKRIMKEKNRRTMEEQSANGKNSGNGTSDNLNKENGIEAPGGREPVSNGAKLPLLSGSKDIADKLERPMNGDGGSYKAFDLSGEENKGDVKDQTFFSDLVKEEGFESMTSFDPSKVSKSGNELVLLKEKLNLQSSSTDKMWEEKRTSKDVSFDPRKDGRIKVEKNFNMCTVDSDGFRGRTDLAGGSDDPSEQKAVQKATSYEQNVEKASQGKEGKKKKKGNQSNDNPAVEFPKQSSKSISFVARKDKKSSQAQDSLSGIRSDAIKPFKVSSKTISRECQRDSLGDTKVQQADNRTNSVEMSFKDKMKDSKLDSEKETHSFVEKSEKYAAKKVENPSTSEAYANASAPLSVNGPGTDAVIAPALPVVIEENWVCCDKCQTWRLLPYGRNPNLLGKKWRCSMLDWLPGMNKCSISEDETTKALNALYQLPVPEGHNSVQGQYNGVASGKASADVRHPNQSHEHSLVMPNIGRKKHALKDTSNAIDNTILTPPPNSMKRNQQSSVKIRSSTDANKVAFPDTSKSTDVVNEKKGRKQTEQHKVLESNSGQGDYIHQSRKYPKTKDKRESDCDNGFTTSKKIKKEGSHCNYEDWQSDCDVRKEIPNPSNELLIKVTGKDPKHNGYSSSKDSKGNTRDSSLSSRKKLKGQLQVPSDGEYKEQFVALDMGRPNEIDFAAKKRKLKEWQQSQGYAETLQNNGPVSVKDEISESELRREKKMKSSKSEDKEHRKSKPDGRIEKNGGATKIVLSASRDPLAYGMEEESGVGYGNQGNAVSQRTRDGMDLSKREPVYPTQTSTAATSSSSKVSGSHKSRGNLPEVKYSPVESVSSSPLRGSNTDKLTTAARRNILIKEDAPNVCFPVVVSSPRRCSDGEVEGRNDQSGSIRKEKASTVQHKSLEMQRDADSLMLHNYLDEDAHQMSSGKAKNKTLSKSVVGMQNNPSSEFENMNVVNGGADTADQHIPYLNEEQGKDLDHDSGEPNNHYQINGSGERKLGKGSSLLSRDMHRNARFDIDKDNVKVSDSCIEQEELYPKKSLGVDAGCQDVADFESRDLLPYRENFRDAKCNMQKAHSVKSDKENKNYPVKNDPTTKLPGEGQRDSHSTSGPQGSPLQIKQHTDLNSRGGKSGAICIKGGKSNLQHNFPQTMSREDVRSSDLLTSDRTERAKMALGRGKSQSFNPPGDKQESDGKGSRPDVFPVDASVDGTMKVPIQPNGVHHSNVRKTTPNGFVGRDLDCRSQHIKDYGQVAAKVLKEAKDLKHSADRLKRGDGELDSTNLFFRAALKFLHGASLLELCSSESAKNGETTPSMKYYTDTAMLCMFCAREYEKCNEMAAAALAYKCVEVAYMKVIFSKHSCASRDQCKLQKALQTVPSGESPSSSASDVDDLNNQSTLGKVSLGKGIDTPQPASNHVIPASSRPNYERMLSYVQYMNSAMEASRKSQQAFAAARVDLKEARYSPKDISSVRDVLDFNFHEVERLIRLVRLAMEAIRC